MGGFSAIGLPQRVLTVSVDPCLYGLTIDHALEEATYTLVYILDMQKKTRFLKSHWTRYEYFKNSLIVNTDISCFDLTIAFSNSLLTIINEVLNKIKIVVRILSRKGCI